KLTNVALANLDTWILSYSFQLIYDMFLVHRILYLKLDINLKSTQSLKPALLITRTLPQLS
ncbi:hypothetical protein AVEN_213679-2-1, partial [Araneus ventricosus]